MIAKTLSTLNISRLGPLLSGFFSWWKGQLEGFLPNRLVPFLSRGGNTLGIQLGKEDIVLEEKNSQAFSTEAVLKEGFLETVFNKIPKEFTRIVFTVDPALLFKKKIKVPKANSGQLRKIVELQIERLFPLESDHLYFSISENDKGWVTLNILKRTDIDPILKALKKSSLKDKKLIVFPSGKPAGGPFHIPLAAPSFSLDFLKNTFVFSLVFWILVSLAYVFYLDRVSFGLEQKIADLQGAVSAEMATVSAYENRLLKKQAIADELKEIPVLSLFDTLAEVFPENSWVDDASISGNQIILSGTHPSPPDLVSALTETGAFRDVRLTSSEEISGISRFQISLTLAASLLEASQ